VKSVGAIVLAAGRSRRMGTQKLLLPFGPSTVIGRVVDQVQRSAVDRILVVVGEDRARLIEALGDRPVQWVLNPEALGDMLSSVRCGLRALPPEDAGVLVVLGDQPGITAAAVDGLLQAFRSGAGRIVVPSCGGRRGHPLLLDRCYVGELLEHFDGVGLRGFLRAHAAEVIEVPLPASAILEDMDEPADYLRLRGALNPPPDDA
jgi:molybdenum cofactor cytidylyltransferase